jgi:hypothetical protein
MDKKPRSVASVVGGEADDEANQADNDVREYLLAKLVLRINLAHMLDF